MYFQGCVFTIRPKEGIFDQQTPNTKESSHIPSWRHVFSSCVYIGCSNTVSTKLQFSNSFSEEALQNNYPSPSKQLKDGKRIKKMWAPKSKCLSFSLQNCNPHHALEGGLYKMKNLTPQTKSAHTNTHTDTNTLIQSN